MAPLQDHARLRGRKPGNQKNEGKMDRYYYACDASSFDRHLKDVDVLVSAGLCWKKEGCCGAGRLAVPKYLDGARSIMIDSGAYSFKELHVQKIGRKQEIGGGFPNPGRPGEIRAIPPPCGHGFTHKPYVAIRATKPDPPFV